MTEIIKQAREVLKIEAEGILNLIDRVGEAFAEAVDLIYHSKGRVVVTGIGKSGLVGRKIVATLNSTGTPAIFLHPVEALHGDLGMVMADDVLVALSNSGETVELNAIMGSVRALGARIIAMTGDPQSTLAKAADVVLDVGVAREACPLGLAPTASTTAALAMGDALAVALINSKRFNTDDFQAPPSRRQPGGKTFGPGQGSNAHRAKSARGRSGNIDEGIDHGHEPDQFGRPAGGQSPGRTCGDFHGRRPETAVGRV